MDALFNNETLSLWLLEYGSILMFFLLFAGILILPVPEDTLMILAGVLMGTGHLHIPSTFIAAYLGSICGITTSYLVGRLAGNYIVARYGQWPSIKLQLDRARSWFLKYGKATLLIGYFIPGLRHFTGFTSGISHMEFRPFAMFAWSGAVIWSSILLSIGFYFGDCCFTYLQDLILKIDKVFFAAMAIVIVVVAFIVYKILRNRS